MTKKEETTITEVKPKKTSKWVIVLIVIGCLYYLVPLGLFFFAMVTDNFKTEYKILNDGTIQIDKNKLTISNDVRGYYNAEKKAYYIEGKIKNNTNKDYNSINIDYYLYNESGEVLGAASTYLQKLGANKTWNFKVIYDEVDAINVYKFEYNPDY